MLSVCDAGHGGRAKELTRLGIASGAGKAARSLSRYVKENRTLVVTSVCAIVLVMLLENVLDKENMKLDAAAWWLFGEQLRQPWLTPIMESFSALAAPRWRCSWCSALPRPSRRSNVRAGATC